MGLEEGVVLGVGVGRGSVANTTCKLINVAAKTQSHTRTQVSTMHSQPTAKAAESEVVTITKNSVIWCTKRSQKHAPVLLNAAQKRSRRKIKS